MLFSKKTVSCVPKAQILKRHLTRVICQSSAYANPCAENFVFDCSLYTEILKMADFPNLFTNYILYIYIK